MTDRIQNLTVVLSHDMRKDDVELVMKAISMIKCVRDVQLGEPLTPEDFLARHRVYGDVREALFDVLKPFGINQDE